MWRITPQRRFATVIAVIVLAAAIPAFAVPIDSTWFTTYTINTTHTSLDWVVCGSTQSSSGCYASGALGPFAKVGAILAGNPQELRSCRLDKACGLAGADQNVIRRS